MHGEIKGHRHIITGGTRPFPGNLQEIEVDMLKAFGGENITQQGPDEVKGVWFVDVLQEATPNQRQEVKKAGYEIS